MGISIIFLYSLPKPHWSSERFWVVFLTPFDTAMPPWGNSHFLLFSSYCNILLWCPIKVPFPSWGNFLEDSLRNTIWLFCSDPRHCCKLWKILISYISTFIGDTRNLHNIKIIPRNSRISQCFYIPFLVHWKEPNKSPYLSRRCMWEFKDIMFL